MGKLANIFRIQEGYWIFRIQGGEFKKGGGNEIKGGSDPVVDMRFMLYCYHCIENIIKSGTRKF